VRSEITDQQLQVFQKMWGGFDDDGLGVSLGKTVRTRNLPLLVVTLGFRVTGLLRVEFDPFGLFFTNNLYVF